MTNLSYLGSDKKEEIQCDQGWHAFCTYQVLQPSKVGAAQLKIEIVLHYALTT